MNRAESIKKVKELLQTDIFGGDKAAVEMAFHALEEPESMSCGYCQKFADEEEEGCGWCEQHDREAHSDDKACGYYE